MSPKTWSIVMFTMVAGMGKITAATQQKFLTRMRAWELAHGPFLQSKDKNNPYYISADDIQKHVGLETNVFPMESDIKFAKKLGASVVRRATESLYRDAKEAVEARKGKHEACKQEA